MLDIENKNYKPSTDELIEFVNNSAFKELCEYMNTEYGAVESVEFSGDKVLYGWNLKFKKAGRTLCTVYPRKEYFSILLVIGRKEKKRVEELLPFLSNEFKKTYNNTREGMGQRWLIFDFTSHSEVFDDALKIVKIRRNRK